jgi:hypothetical protein
MKNLRVCDLRSRLRTAINLCILNMMGAPWF